MIQSKDWYGLNHERVAQQFEGGLTYVNTFNVLGEYSPVAVYHAAAPNRSKGHKEYMLLLVKDKTGIVRGMERDELEPFAKRAAIKCVPCDEVVWSCMRHDAATCKCGNVMVDGGSDYVRCSLSPTPSISGTVNLLTNEFTPDKDGT